jgi:hypothetical protein
MKKIFTLLTAWIAMATILFSQSDKPAQFCSYTGIDPWLIEYQNNPASAKTAAELYVPMTVHLLGNDNNSGYFSVVNILNTLNTVNQDFEQYGIQFYLARYFNYIARSEWNVHPEFSAGQDMMVASNIAGSVNAYFVSDAAGNCGYFNPAGDAVAIARSCSGADDHTLAHELGHFFSLPHTFSGWEGRDYKYSDPTPKAIYGRQVEKVDRSNCKESGDRFCDTPADYLSYRWSCDNEGLSNVIQKDPDSVQFRSDGTYFMSYSNDGCMDKFSAEQVDAIRANILTRRTTLSNNLLPAVNKIPTSEPIILIYPADGETVPTTEAVMTWEPVTNASHYFIEVSLWQNFAVILDHAVVTTTSFVTDKIKPGRKYYWRIRPFSLFSFDQFYSPTWSFKTESVSATVGIPAISQLSVYPSPATADQPLTLAVDSERQMPLQVRLVQATGQLVSTSSFSVQPGTNSFVLPLPALSAGLYFLHFENEFGRAIEKIIVK